MTARRASSMRAPAASGRKARRTGRALAAYAACAAAALAGGLELGACERHADIRDEPEAGVIKPQPQIDAGDIPELDSGLATDAYPTCAERPEGDCRGTNDFLCDFANWATSTAETCQRSTGCKTNGWVEVKMGADGCVVELGMTEPNDEMVACLLAEFGSKRCPCGEEKITYFFGYGNDGVCEEPGPSG